MNLPALREQTREQHEETEALLPLTDPELDRERYTGLLLRFSPVVLGWDAWAAQHAPASLQTMVYERRRSPLLIQDLHHFQLEPTPASASAMEDVSALLAGFAPDSPAHQAAFLGAMYVMEGSTLGGQYIARHVEERLGLQPGEGDAYFRGYGERTGAMGNGFRGVLAAVPEEHTELVISAAKTMFAFVQNTLRCLPPTHTSAQTASSPACARP